MKKYNWEYLTSRVNCTMLEGTCVSPNPKLSCVLFVKNISFVNKICCDSTSVFSSINKCSYRVYLSQHSPLSKEQRLPRVHNHKVKVGAPGLFRIYRLELRIKFSWLWRTSVQDLEASSGEISECNQLYTPLSPSTLFWRTLSRDINVSFSFLYMHILCYKSFYSTDLHMRDAAMCQLRQWRKTLQTSKHWSKQCRI